MDRRRFVAGGVAAGAAAVYAPAVARAAGAKVVRIVPQGDLAVDDCCHSCARRRAGRTADLARK